MGLKEDTDKASSRQHRIFQQMPAWATLVWHKDVTVFCESKARAPQIYFQYHVNLQLNSIIRESKSLQKYPLGHGKA